MFTAVKRILFVTSAGLAALIFLSAFATACNIGGDTSQSNDISSSGTTSSSTTTISPEYWGTWIQMDTGDEYYIDNQKIYKVTGSSKSASQSGISGYTLDESQMVLKKGYTVYFRKGGKTRSFKASFSGFASSGAARAVSTGSQSISGRRQNKSNAADSETFTATTNGEEISFEGGVAGDSQQITVDGSDTSASFTPQYDGENVGTIPVVESGRYAFKTTYTVSNADEQGMMYGNLLGKYNISFNFTNVGSAICSTSMYEISWDDNNLRSDDFETSGNFNSIEPGKEKSVKGTFYYGQFTDEYKDVVVNIKIQDSGYGETWNDSVVLRFYRGYVNLKVNARNFNSSSSARLNGFLIYPDGRSKRFEVSSGSTSTVSVPWNTSDYYVVLSGATSETEMGYSFGTMTEDLSGTWKIEEINAHESNDSIAQAVSVSDLTKPVKAYLKVNDLDYYKINVSSLTCEEGGAAYAGYEKIDDSTSLGTLNNGDGSINPGETVALDVAVQNTSPILLENVTVTVSSTSQYATLTGGSADYGNIKVRYYQTGSYHKAYSNGEGLDRVYYTDNFSSYAPFRLTVSEDCPIGTKIPIAVKMTDARGRVWTDDFTLSVVQTGTEMEYAEYTIDDGTSLGTLNNGDGSINPGETVVLDVAVKNSGTSLAQSITVTVSSTSQYATLTGGSADYGNIKVRYYQTGSYHKAYSNGEGLDRVYYTDNFSSYAPFRLTVSEGCPIGTKIPITVNMTDVRGRKWTDTFSIAVQ